MEVLITTPTLWWKLVTILTSLPVHTSTWYEELTHWKSLWCWERLSAGAEGMTENETVGWHHQLNGHEFEQTLGGGEGQGKPACCGPWGHRVGHNWATQQEQQFSLFHSSPAFLHNFIMYLCNLKKNKDFLPAFETLKKMESYWVVLSISLFRFVNKIHVVQPVLLLHNILLHDYIPNNWSILFLIEFIWFWL